ncbi:hypothetical protein [uncultured Devosia sp.]|uniref:hypothetical protein n=1 Tax=uncultured Devosia sp. TaxID=211434 RepID=UPI0026225EEB|nr:hypothetical protein [uncultured Devosia sp.]
MQHYLIAALAAFSLVFSPSLAAAQSVNVTRSILPTQPYTLIFPEPMVASGGGADPLIVNHPDAPLQCELQIVPVEDTGWSAEMALDTLDDAAVASSWTEIMPGFTLNSKGTAAYQDATALIYDGSSPESAMGVPLTVVHTETVSNGRGYVLDCLYATDQAAQARPIVDFIIANFATRSDAECCIGVEVAPDPEAAPAQ